MGQSELKAELGGGGVTPGKMPPCIFDRSLFYFFQFYLSIYTFCCICFVLLCPSMVKMMVQ